MKNKKVFKILIAVLLVIGLSTLLSKYSTADEVERKEKNFQYFTPNTERFGVWWWNTNDLDDLSYLDFAYHSGITEIYLNQHALSIVNPNGNFGPNGMNNVVEPTRRFIREANSRGIEVFLLLSNTGTWVFDDRRAHFHQIMLGYISYQALVNENERFAGLHFNVEPNQLRDQNGLRYWDRGFEAQSYLMQRLIDFSVMATDTYGVYTTISWSTGWWWYRYDVDYRGNVVPLHHAIITESDTTVVMSFRRNAQDMVSIARTHIDFAQSIRRPIFVSATIISSEGASNAQFYQYGREYMYEELLKIPYYANYENVHVAIHKIVSWRHWTSD